MPFRLKPHRVAEDPGLEAAARELATHTAVREYGPNGFCVQVIRINETREFRCYIAHQSGKAGGLIGKTVVITVPDIH